HRIHAGGARLSDNTTSVAKAAQAGESERKFVGARGDQGGQSQGKGKMAQAPRGTCKYYFNNGTCRKEGCSFRHDQKRTARGTRERGGGEERSSPPEVPP